MEPKFQSSFIPKGPIAAASPLAAQYNNPKPSFFGFVAMLLFIISLVLSVGAFAYDRYLLSDIGTMGDNLTSVRATLQPDTIQELVNADKRIIGTRQLVARHTALSPFFDYLENATLKNVRFTDFAYVATDKGIELTMKGQAHSYQDVALQSDAFNTSKIFTNPVFSGLDLDNKGNVIFSFHASIDPSVVSYKKRLEGMPIVVPTATTTPVATITATSTLKTATSTALKTATSTATSTKSITP